MIEYYKFLLSTSSISSSLDNMAENENPIRFGTLGCAEIARKVCRAIHLSPNATLVAIASRSIDKAKQFAARNKLSSEKVKLYGSYEELLDDPIVDAVYMPLPTTLHVKWGVLAAQKGKHLLLEKPTALDVNMFDEMFEACESTGVQFMDASMWYHHPRTAKMKEVMSNSELFGRVKSIHSSSSYCGTSHFLENDIRVKPDLDSLGALGDAGWYCIGAILWTMNQKLPTTVTALPTTQRNSSGVILSCSASLYWNEEQTIATFYCSFISHETMDLAVSGSNGSLHVEDFIIPYEENSAAFSFTSGAKFADLHIGWNVKPKKVEVPTQLPQEAMMIQEFSRLVKGIRDVGVQPDTTWAQTSRTTQQKLQENALGVTVVVLLVTGSFVLSLVLDIENSSSRFDLKLRYKLREMDSELNGILSWIDKLEVTWLLTLDPVSEMDSASRSKFEDFMICWSF